MIALIERPAEGVGADQGEAGGEVDGGEGGAPVKGVAADRGEAVRELDRGKRSAAVERSVTDRDEAARACDGGERLALEESTGAKVGEAVGQCRVASSDRDLPAIGRGPDLPRVVERRFATRVFVNRHAGKNLTSTTRCFTHASV